MRPHTIAVVADSHPSVGGTWHDANRTTLYFRNNITGETRALTGTYGGSNPWQSRSQAAVNEGQEVELPLDGAVLELTSYPKTARLYVHPEAVTKFIPAPTDVLSWAERVVLAATRGLKSSYGGVKEFRKVESMKDTGISAGAYDAAKASLIKTGHLDSRGAITAKGKNAIGWTSLDELRREKQ
jgi:hypothetical protein